ncbi:MAG TPA: extracellular solute-binding protein [Terrimicrobiaceae bacterium]
MLEKHQAKPKVRFKGSPPAIFPKLQEAFNNKFKDQGISVKLKPIPSYNETMRSAFTTGGLPDIIMVDGPDMSNYVWSGQLAPLDEYLDDALKQDLLPAIKDQGTYPPDGKICMVSPYDSTVIIWANKAYLEKAGVRIPKTVEDAWTLEEFEDAMAKLAKVEGVRWPLDLKLNCSGEWWIYGFSPLIQDAGEDVLNRQTYKASGTLDSDASAEALAHLQKWVKNGWVVPATAGENCFYGDKSAAMAWVGNWKWPAHREGLGDNLLQIPAPKFGSKRHVSPNGGWGWSLPAGGKNKEAAGKFVNFAMSPEMVALWADTTGYAPPRRAARPLSKLFKEGDDARNLDSAIERLSDAGIEEVVLDRSIVSQEAFSSVAGTFLSGSPGLPASSYVMPTHAPGPPGVVPGASQGEIIELFRIHLGDYKLSDEVIKNYATSFEHGGKVVIIKVDKARAEEVVSIFKKFDAAQIHRHD